jgi:hypothetical protein
MEVQVSVFFFHPLKLVADIWHLSPDRWDNLPEPVKDQPGMWANIMTFSAGPRVSHNSACAHHHFADASAVVHWTAFLYDRDEIIPVHPPLQFRVPPDRRTGV